MFALLLVTVVAESKVHYGASPQSEIAFAAETFTFSRKQSPAKGENAATRPNKEQASDIAEAIGTGSQSDEAISRFKEVRNKDEIFEDMLNLVEEAVTTSFLDHTPIIEMKSSTHSSPKRASRGSNLLNWLLEDAEIGLPTISFSLPIPGNPINCTVKLSCNTIHVGPMSLVVQNKTNSYSVNLEIADLSHTCSGDLWIVPKNDVNKRHRLGIQVFTPTSSLLVSWKFYWSDAKKRAESRRDHIPSSVSVNKCKARVHYTDESFRLINDDMHVITALDQEILNALAPWFGPLVMDPMYCLGVRSGTITTSMWMKFLRLNMDWFIRDELPRHPDSIERLEATVRPRVGDYGPSDRVLSANNTISRFISAVSEQLLSSRTPLGGMLLNQAIQQSLLPNGPGSRMLVVENSSYTLASIEIFDVRLTLRLKELWIQGLDSFEILHLAKPIGKYSVGNEVKMFEPLRLNATFQIEEAYSGSAEHVKLDESFSFDMLFDPVDLKMSLLAGIDELALSNFTLGSVLASPLSCAPVLLANLTLAQLELGKKFYLPRMHIKGSDDIFHVIDSAIQVSQQVIASPLWSLVQAHGDSIAQTLSRYVIEPVVQSRHCPPQPWPPQPHKPDFFSFNKSTVLRAASWALEDFLGTSGALNVGAIMKWALGYAFGPKWHSDKDLLDLTNSSIKLGPVNVQKFFPSLPDPSTAEITFSHARLKGLTHIVELFMHANSSKADELIAGSSFERFEFEGELAWRLTGVAASGLDIVDHIQFEFAYDTIDFLGSCRAYLDKDVVEMLNLNHALTSCFSLIFPTPSGAATKGKFRRLQFAQEPSPVGFDNLELAFGNVSFAARCVNCTSPYLASVLEFASEPASQRNLNEFISHISPALEDILTNSSTLALLRGMNINFALNNLITLLQHTCESGHAWPQWDEIVAAIDLERHKYVKPWWLPPIKALLVVGASVMLLGFSISVILARRRSSVLRKTQSERLATTLLRTDFLNTGGSSSASQSNTGRSEHGADNEMDEDVTPTLEREGVSDSASNLPAGQSSEGSSGVSAQSQRVNSSSNSTPVGVSPKDYHREVVQDFRRQVRDCASSRNTLLQSPEEMMSESDRLYLLGHDRPMIRHPSIGRVTGILIATLLGINFSLFVSGNFFTLGRVTIFATFSGDTFREVPIVVLTLDYCIDLLAEGNAIIFFIFIGFCSGILPWLRVAMLAYAWVAPANVLTVEHRGYLLRSMESMGKWVMAIIYVFMIMSASMNTTITAPVRYMPFLKEEALVVYIECVPMWGLTSFLVSAALSTFMNHLIILFHDRIVMHNLRAVQVKQSNLREASGVSATLSAAVGQGRELYHVVPDYPMDEELEEAAYEHAHRTTGRQTVRSDQMHLHNGVESEQEEEEESASTIFLSQRGFRHPDRFRLDDDEIDDEDDGTAEHIRSRAMGLWFNQLFRVLVGLGVILWPVAFLLTFTQPVYEFEFMGIAGIGTDLFGIDEHSGKVRRETLLSLIPALWHSDPADESSILAKTLLLFVYFLLIVVAPALGILVAVALWFFPMTKWLKHRLLMLFRIAHAWNSTNVICATLFVMSIEVYRFFDVVAAGLSFCPPVVGRLFYELGAPSYESVCFGVASRLDDGWYTLLGFVVYSFFLCRLVFFFVADGLSRDFDHVTVLLL